MSRIIDTSDTMMSICRLSLRKVAISCSGSRWIPTLKKEKDLYKHNIKFKIMLKKSVNKLS